MQRASMACFATGPRRPPRRPVPPARVAEIPPPDAGTATARGDPLDAARDGQDRRHSQRRRCKRHLEGPWFSPSSLAAVQALQRPGLRRETHQHRWPYMWIRPAHAVVLSVDEKSQIQASTAHEPGLPMKKGRRPER